MRRAKIEGIVGQCGCRNYRDGRNLSVGKGQTHQFDELQKPNKPIRESLLLDGHYIYRWTQRARRDFGKTGGMHGWL